MKRGLSYEDLAAAYEIRNGFDTPTPWKWIARGFGVNWKTLYCAIRRLELGGLNRDANGEKPLSRVTKISEVMLHEIEQARIGGMSWPRIAKALGLPVGTVQGRYWRWKKRSE